MATPPNGGMLLVCTFLSLTGSNNFLAFATLRIGGIARMVTKKLKTRDVMFRKSSIELGFQFLEQIYQYIIDESYFFINYIPQC